MDADNITHLDGKVLQFLNCSTRNRYTLDAFGNLSQKTPMAGMLSGENFSQTVLSNNRLAGFGYDAAGNTTSDDVNTYTYDAENQIVSAVGVTYTYDGNGDRVKKSSGRLYWYGAPGIVAESDLSGNLTAEYVFFDGERIARRDLPSGTVHYYFSDHLKSVSVVTSATGAIEEESDYRPWGEEKVITHTLADQHFKFNGKERDSETGFDEFGARLYSSAWSRWLTPDWSADPTPVPYAQMDNPQSLNLYEYALNNPTTLPDLDGHLTPLGSCCGGAQAPVDFSFDQMLSELEYARWAERTQGAAGKQPATKKQKKHKRRAAVSKKRFSNRNAAATAAEKIALKRTKAINKGKTDWEYGGWIVRDNNNGKYGFTMPLMGAIRGQTDLDNISVPDGFTKAAGYHTHPDESGEQGEGFSTGPAADTGWADRSQTRFYVADVSTRNLYKYDPGVTEVGSDEVTGDFVGHIPE